KPGSAVWFRGHDTRDELASPQHLDRKLGVGALGGQQTVQIIDAADRLARNVEHDVALCESPRAPPAQPLGPPPLPRSASPVWKRRASRGSSGTLWAAMPSRLRRTRPSR